MLEVGRVNFKHVGAHLMLEVRRARLLQAWLIYQSVEVTGFLGGESCTGVQLDDGSVCTARLGGISTLPPPTLLLVPYAKVQLKCRT